MTAARRLAAILAADVVGYSRLMGEDEAETARAVREHREAARPIVASHGGRIVKTTGDGLLLEFPSVVAAVECAIAIQKLMVERNAETPEAKRIVYRIGVNLGDVLVEGDDILGDGVNIAARLEGIAEPGGIFISGAAYDHVRGRIDAHFVDLGEKDLKNIARPVRVYAIKPAGERGRPPRLPADSASGPPRLSIVVLPFANMSAAIPEQDYFVDGVTESLTTDLSRLHGAVRDRAQHGLHLQGQAGRSEADRPRVERSLCPRGERSAQRRPHARERPADRRRERHSPLGGTVRQAVADLFDMQDEIVAHLANALVAQLVAAEARRAERAPNPDSLDLCFQGMAWMHKGLTPDYVRRLAFLRPRLGARSRQRVWAARRCRCGYNKRDRFTC